MFEDVEHLLGIIMPKHPTISMVYVKGVRDLDFGSWHSARRAIRRHRSLYGSYGKGPLSIWILHINIPIFSVRRQLPAAPFNGDSHV